MKKFFILTSFLTICLLSISPKTATARGLCCFNTSIPGLVCFSYMVYEPDGTSHLENVPGIRLSCGEQ